MAKIIPIDVIKGISGKYGSGSNDYFVTNSSSNKVHLAKLVNPYTETGIRGAGGKTGNKKRCNAVEHRILVMNIAKTYARIVLMISSAVTMVCSPVVIFFNVTLPSFISFSPARATNGIFLALA